MADVERPKPITGRSIGDHGVVGNLRTVALVAGDGTVDFMCWPNIDSPTVFAGLLDPDKGGVFELQPRLGGSRTVQLYLPDTNVLLTRWLAEEGSAELTDLMPHPDVGGVPGASLIRRVRVTRGEVRFTLRCCPRFDYARSTPAVTIDADGAAFRDGGGVALRLAGPVTFTAGDGEATADFTLHRGEEAIFALTDAAAPPLSVACLTRAIDATVHAWRKWAGESSYKGRWRGEVMRSALALKLLTSIEHGSVAAAATFGLPEATGADRNWDYRATWLRDASFTVYAFMRLGYVQEAEAFRSWISARAGQATGVDELRIMYAIDGSEAADETTLSHLAGYCGNQPVRIGNAAHGQTQLDIFGELLDSAYLSNKYGSASSHESWVNLSNLANYVCKSWNAQDAGIWEFRDRPRHLLHSRLMCWVALDRAARLAQKRSLPAPLNEWLMERDRIAADIWANFRHPVLGHFVQERGGEDLDAALLMMPLVRFVSATDPVWLATLDAIGDTLTDDGLVYRYRGSDGLQGGEGAFTTCTFWYVECLARAGRLDQARLTMEKALNFANHLGLFSEELDRLGRPLGNFPQALTHLAFISAAHFLDRRLDHPGGGEWQP